MVDAGYHSSWLAQLVHPATQQKKALEPGVAEVVEPPPLAEGAEVAPVAPRNLPASALAALNTQVATVLDDYNDDESAFPEGATDVHKQQLDLRSKNSWVLRLGEVSTPEAAEVMAVNALSPFVLNGKLRPLLEASPRSLRVIVNVSAMEGASAPGLRCAFWFCGAPLVPFSLSPTSLTPPVFDPFFLQENSTALRCQRTPTPTWPKRRST